MNQLSLHPNVQNHWTTIQNNYCALFIFLLYCKLYDNPLTNCEGSKRGKFMDNYLPFYTSLLSWVIQKVYNTDKVNSCGNDAEVRL
ncbi:hypothetical protein OTSTA763_2173 [Orientia tsutsugamushi str. TA763]|nr:hypothetical protein OTSTA763_2173 [Orientia tsutsugamushi str. TA763]